MGCFPTTDMQTPSSLTSGHLDMKDAQRAKKNYGRKISYHIISRLGAAAVQKGSFGRPKIKFIQQSPNFQGELEFLLRSFFAGMIFLCDSEFLK